MSFSVGPSITRRGKTSFWLILHVLFFFAAGAELLAQGTANDECAGAIPVVVPDFGATNFFRVVTTEATESLPRPGCTNTSADDDVWFSFEPTTPGLRVRYRNASLPAGSGGVGYSIMDACDGREVACNFRFGDTEEGDEVVELFLPFTLGATYLIRVFAQGAGGGAFEFGLQPADINDNCDGAIELPVQAVGECEFRRISTDVNTASSTPSTTCSRGGSNNDDEFYRFTATSEFLAFSYENMVASVGATTGLGYSIHNACGGEELYCDLSFGDGASGTQVINPGAPFDIGREYVARLYLQGSTSAGRFDFCVQEATCIPPTVRLSEDFSGCDGAGYRQALLISNLGSATSVTVTTDGGTAPLLFDAPGFQSTEPFAAEGRYEMTLTDSDAPDCSVTLPIEAYCPAENQTCATAAPLIINEADDCSRNNLLNNWYASSGEYPNVPSCSRFEGGDLFYEFVAPAVGINLAFEELPFSPLCAVINEKDCDAGGDQVASGSLREPGEIDLSGLTVGQTYTLRFYDGFNNDFGKASFCARPSTALPVELLEFRGVRNKDNRLTWRTLVEEGVSHFEVQASTNQSDWVAVGEVAAGGVGDGHYTFLHVGVTEDQFYRLKMIDLDGAFAFSSITTIAIEGAPLRVYPNPASSTVLIDLPGGGGAGEVTFRSISGEHLLTTPIGSGQALRLPDVAPGLLLLTVRQGGRLWHRRLVKR